MITKIVGPLATQIDALLMRVLMPEQTVLTLHQQRGQTELAIYMIYLKIPMVVIIG